MNNAQHHSSIAPVALASILLATTSLSVSSLTINPLAAAEIKNQSTSNTTTTPTTTVEEGLSEARKRVLIERPYKLDRYQKISGVELSIAPVSLKTETIPDWWSDKQAYDLSKLIEAALGYYPGLKVIPGKTWDKASVEEELGNTGLTSEETKKPPRRRPDKLQLQTIKMQPIITNYQFQLFKPKKRGLGLIFVAITSKSCKSESFIAFRTELESNNKNSTASLDSLNTGINSGFDLARLQTSETGGTSLNLNAIVAGAGGGDFKPPEKATKELLYDSIVDLAEGSYCLLSGNKECIDYYMQRQQPMPTPPKRDKKGRLIKLKPQDLKC